MMTTQNQQNSPEKKKQKLKLVSYEIVSIPRHIKPMSRQFLLFNDILIDLWIHNDMLEDRFSSWNYCIQLPIASISQNAKVFILEMEPKYYQTQKEILMSMERYKNYPDQFIHSLMIQILELMKYQQLMSQSLNQFMNSFSDLHELKGVQKQLSILFNSYMQTIYEKLSSKGTIFMSTHSSLNFTSKQICYNRFIQSESLSLLLGKTLEEVSDMYSKIGGYNFISFQDQLEVSKLIIEETIKYMNLFLEGKVQPKQPPKKIPHRFKLISYDNIEFYADVQLELFKLSEFISMDQIPLPVKSPFISQQCQFLDIYACVLQFDISLSTISQIREYRIKSFSPQQDIPLDQVIYTEMFLEQFHKQTLLPIEEESSLKQSKYRMIQQQQDQQLW